MNRIDKRFAELKDRGEAGFIPFLTAGDPDLSATVEIVLDLDRRGADVIELGFPYSDPIADGPVIQASYSRALSTGVTVGGIFDAVRQIRKSSEIPIVAMVSYSIVYRYGYARFIEAAQDVGFDGVTVPDLPVEEAVGVFDIGREKDFKIVCFVAPTTTQGRLEVITARAEGFIYYIAVVGITGERKSLPSDLTDNINKLKGKTTCPVAAGFGVSTAEQAAVVGQAADGVIVGSAIIREIAGNSNLKRPRLIDNVGAFTERLIAGAKGSAGSACRVQGNRR